MGIKINSKKVLKGDTFFCLEQDEMRARIYIQNAIDNGASRVVASYDFPKFDIEKANNVFTALKDEILKNYSDKPANLMAITGTNGKTSTAYFVWQALNLLGKNCVYIGTIGIFGPSKYEHIFDKFKNETLTTPDVATLHEILHAAKTKANCDYAIFEASSHGIEQKRIDFLKIKTAGFTNLSQDHLDMHGNMEKYFDAKLKLFTDFIEPDGFCIVNSDDEKSKQILTKTLCKNKITYGFSGDLKICEIKQENLEQNVIFEYQSKQYSFVTSIMGEFQVYNLLCTIGFLLSVNIDISDATSIISKLSAPTGRLERVKNGEKFTNFFIDYAHTPDALEKALLELRKITKGRLFCVFGCGGERDLDKRGKMGVISTSIANFTIITDDNPRGEDPAEIRSQIIKGIVEKKQEKLHDLQNFPYKRVMLFALENEGFFGNFCEIDDRANAIKYAFEHAKEDDVVLIAGKGHETYQIIGNKTIHFSDKEEVLKCFTENN